MNPFERKFKEFAQNLGKQNAEGHATHIAAKSSDTFRDKPFTEEFSTVYKISLWGTGAAQVVTFATTAGLGVFALEHVVPLWWGIYIAVPLGILFAFGVEKIKRSTLAIAAKHFLKYKTFGFVGIVAAIVMCISIAAALYGAKELPGVFYPIPARTVDAANAGQLSADIERVQTDIDRVQGNLKSSKNWVAENRTLPKLQKQRADMVAMRDGATKDANGRSDADHTEALAARNEKVDKMQVYAVAAAAVAELVFLFCTGFILYYLFRAFAEKEQEAKGESEEVPKTQPATFSRNGAATAHNLRADADRTTQNVHPARAHVHADVLSAAETTEPHRTILTDGQRTCEHCQAVYTYGHRRQKFCTEKCRIESWQEKNGKQIRHRINAS